MIEYLYDEQDELIAWAEKRGPPSGFRNDARAIGRSTNGVIRAVIVYDGFSSNDCLFHITSDGKPNWFTREFAVRTLAYPFNQCHLNRITALVAFSNRPAVQFVMRFGDWVQEGRMREAAEDGSDLLLFGMLKRECTWLKAKPMPDMAMAV